MRTLHSRPMPHEQTWVWKQMQAIPKLILSLIGAFQTSMLPRSTRIAYAAANTSNMLTHLCRHYPSMLAPKMAPENMADVLHPPNELCYFVIFFCIFTLRSPTRRISCFHWNRPRSPPFAWRKDAGKRGADRAPFWESGGEWINSHCLPFFLLTCNHCKITFMTYD